MSTVPKTHPFIPILDAVREGVEVVDANGIIQYVNPAFEQITRTKALDRIGRNINEVHPDGFLVRVLREGKEYLGVKTQAGGSYTDVLCNFSPIKEADELRGAVCVLQDVSEVVRLSAHLQEQKALLKTMYDQVGRARYHFSDIIGESVCFTKAIAMAKRMAQHDSTILIQGETGSGKELLAHAIHLASPRAQHPFIRVDCSTLERAQLKERFYGRAVIGEVDEQEAGLIELCRGGTLYLDEVTSLDWDNQGQLLYLLEHDLNSHTGSSRAGLPQIIVSTMHDLRPLVDERRFREDLYYHLKALQISLPPLRERGDDIFLLTQAFVTQYNRRFQKQVSKVAPGVVRKFKTYPWPGNVRELKHIIERAILLVEGETLDMEHVFVSLEEKSTEEILPLPVVEKQMIEAALRRFGTSVEGKQKAAEALNISLGTLYNKLRQFK